MKEGRIYEKVCGNSYRCSPYIGNIRSTGVCRRTWRTLLRERRWIQSLLANRRCTDHSCGHHRNRSSTFSPGTCGIRLCSTPGGGSLLFKACTILRAAAILCAKNICRTEGILLRAESVLSHATLKGPEERLVTMSKENKKGDSPRHETMSLVKGCPLSNLHHHGAGGNRQALCSLLPESINQSDFPVSRNCKYQARIPEYRGIHAGRLHTYQHETTQGFHWTNSPASLLPS